MQGELCRYGNLVITSSSLHPPSRLLLPTPLLPHAFHLEKDRLWVGGEEVWAAAAATGKLGQSFSLIGCALPVIRGIGIHVYFILTVSDFAF